MTKRTFAEKSAAELIGRLGVNELPVPVEKIASMLGAKVQYQTLAVEVSGMLQRAGDQAVIDVNRRHVKTRQRFTVAHECGHLVLHDGVFIDRLVRVNWRNGRSDPEEIQANAFAAELLMPREFLASEIDQLMAGRREIAPKQLVANLAKIFVVSNEAMRYRLVNLGVLGPYSDSGGV